MKTGLLSIGFIFVLGGVAGLASSRPLTVFAKTDGGVRAVTFSPEVKTAYALAAVVVGAVIIAAGLRRWKDAPPEDGDEKGAPPATPPEQREKS
jgi:hypothetical protein